MKKVLFVCGTFDEEGGRPSTVGQYLRIGFTSSPLMSQHDCCFMNGGYLSDLEMAAHKAASADIVVWMANVPNSHPKSNIRNIKVFNPTCVLVTSKRLVEKSYTLPGVVQHALKLHANLVLVFEAKADCPGQYKGTLLDPLGNKFFVSDTPVGFINMGEALAVRVDYLSKLRRKKTVQAAGPCETTPPDSPALQDFLKLVRSSAEKYSSLIPSPEPVQRFVGNASFRCTHGFPALRNPTALNQFYVSRRNVDKTISTINDFVLVMDETPAGELVYCGLHKPSVDAPIQAALFQLYPNINYMLHGHVYVQGALLTSAVLPCGALLEASEVWGHFPNHDADNFVINLRGHGFIAGAATPEALERLVVNVEARPLPESQEEWLQAQLTKVPKCLTDD